MPVKKPTRKALAARRALQKAHAATRRARKSISRLGNIKASVTPIAYPPHEPDTICKTLTLTKGIILHPPHVPTEFICKPRRRKDPIEIRIKDFKEALDAIASWEEYLLKVFNKIYPKQPARRKRKPRP